MGFSRLAEMTEIDRETILEDRRDKIQTFQNRQLLKAMVSGQEATYAADSDTKPTRRKAQSGKAKQLDELKRRRKAKSERNEKRTLKGDVDGDSEYEKTAGPSFSSEEAASEDEDNEYGSGNEKRQPGSKMKEIDKASHDDLRKIILRRGQLATFWPTSFFSEYVTGAFVRQGVGLRDGSPEYRLAQIVGVAEKKASRAYQLEKHRTDIMLTLQIGNDKKDFTMEQTSNSNSSDVSSQVSQSHPAQSHT